MPAPSETIIELPVRGMTCAHCVATVQNALERTVGVLAAKVALKPGRASVTFDPTATDRSALQRAITAAGYSVPNDSETTAETQVQIHAIGPLLAPKPPVSGTSEDWNLAVGGMHCASCVARVEKTLRRYGGSLSRLYQVRAQREDTFQRERDKRPDTWHIDWRNLRPSTVRLALGCPIGETPPEGLALPAIVPS